MRQSIRKNNFDLIRLLAALQVLVFHTITHLKIQNNIVEYFSKYFLSLFPGVPIFFFISGFLIYGSFERNKNTIIRFFVNRFLRIFPALWFCLLLTVLILLIDFNRGLTPLLSKSFLTYIIAQLSFFQFYTPEILRFWGVGTPNGSLWTITVEIQFYIIVPILYILFSKKLSKFWLIFFILFTLSCLTNFYFGNLINKESLASKLMGVSVFPYFYYFLIGVIFKNFWRYLRSFFEQKIVFWLFFYLLFSYTNNFIFHFNTTSYYIQTPMNLIGDFILAGVTFSFAYSYRNISNKLLKNNDISYGLYIYHMLVVNFLVQRNYIGHGYYIFIVIIITMILALLSWVFVEKPCLKLKHITLIKRRKHDL